MAARRIDDDDVLALRTRLLETFARCGHRILALPAVHRNLQLAPKLLELVDRRRALKVRGDEGGRLALLAEEQGELGGRRRLPRALQAREEDDARRAACE